MAESFSIHSSLIFQSSLKKKMRRREKGKGKDEEEEKEKAKVSFSDFTDINLTKESSSVLKIANFCFPSVKI